MTIEHRLKIKTRINKVHIQQRPVYTNRRNPNHEREIIMAAYKDIYIWVPKIRYIPKKKKNPNQKQWHTCLDYMTCLGVAHIIKPNSEHCCSLLNIFIQQIQGCSKIMYFVLIFSTHSFIWTWISSNDLVVEQVIYWSWLLLLWCVNRRMHVWDCQST